MEHTQNTVEHIARQLAAGIVTGMYPVGKPLPTEARLSEHFSVSRPTVRGALKWLAGQGLTQSRRGSGHIVTAWWHNASPAVLGLALAHIDLGGPAGRTLVTDVLDARISLWCDIIEAVCLRRDETLLVHAAEAMEGLKEPTHILRSEVALFRGYADAQPNIVMRMACYNICDAVEALWHRAPFVPENAQAYVQGMHKLHQQIEMAMVQDAVDGAKARWAMHGMEVRRTLVA